MLESLWVNFQKVQRLLEFDPHITVITGPTNAGKSACLRCLRWLALNLPRGESFVPFGAKLASAVLKVDGHTIKRVRGSGRNEYWLDDQTKPFVSFINDVPEPISSLLNVATVNFQLQLNSPFWLSLPPGEVSRELNAVVDLACIDNSLAAAATEVRAARSELEFTEKRLEEARAERDRLQYVQELDADLKRLEAMDRELIQERLDCARIEELVTRGKGLQAEADRLSTAVLTASDGINRVEVLVEQLVQDTAWCTAVQNILKEIAARQAVLETAERAVTEADREIKRLSRVVCPECGKPLEVA